MYGEAISRQGNFSFSKNIREINYFTKFGQKEIVLQIDLTKYF